jgi:hypothetical protein
MILSCNIKKKVKEAKFSFLDILVVTLLSLSSMHVKIFKHYREGMMQLLRTTVQHFSNVVKLRVQ